MYLHVRVAPHERFERDGIDLHTELHVPVTQAALGAVIDITTLEGDEPITLHAGTQTGTVLRLKTKGVPHPGGRGRGDLLVHVVVDTPTNLSAEAEALLRKLADERKETVAEHSTGLFGRIKSAFS